MSPKQRMQSLSLVLLFVRSDKTRSVNFRTAIPPHIGYKKYVPQGQQPGENEAYTQLCDGKNRRCIYCIGPMNQVLKIMELKGYQSNRLNCSLPDLVIQENIYGILFQDDELPSITHAGRKNEHETSRTRYMETATG
ncbi:predicted protein [Sclerotinia sclerotiorum 1980 UF-70]|uniref:Uncharacterized protein n=1 Tax=Sclerotinia sclerotiorum (strain ATCC 18683 / 1980 / Ss-1) TaxID=665079 RepID=A7F367_SCLS1|nr:predicted protein [Sclerotinia sclerotiorum 1980 UF-70]EDN97188.1 predicted protein [Sclerotinia sclerotiorum 1980 UF-70]